MSARVTLVAGFSLPTPPHDTAIKTPEEVVQRQLNAFAKCNVAQAFEFNSPTNQDMVGPWESFAAALSEPAFRPILGHAESTVLMTISHDDGDYVCCLVKIVPGKGALPESLQKVIDQNRQDEGFQAVEDDDDDDNDDYILNSKKLPPCVLYWWEVSKQFENEDDPDDYYYQVDSLLPDAEDMEMDYMETTMFTVDDEDDEYDEDDDEDDDGFFFDLGIS
jgi:hypothetical protein